MIAVVTGAGSGIGRAAARALMQDGWSVVAAGRREAPLRETLSSGDGLAVATDVTDAEAVAALFAAAPSRFGRVDLLFNNAGIGLTKPITEIEPDEWRAVVDTNLTGSFLCAQAAFRVMAAQDPRGGRIINNGSLSAYVPQTALDRLHRDQARDHRPHPLPQPRRPRVRHRLRPARHRQRRDRDDRAHERGRSRRLMARSPSSRRSTSTSPAAPSPRWPRCRSRPTCSS